MKNITSKEFDEKFDAGDDLMEYCDTESIRQPEFEQKRVNVDCPVWMIKSLDRAAREIGITRQALIKFWLAEKLRASM